MSFNTMTLELLKAFINTFLIFILTLIGSLPLGLIVYFLKVSKSKIVRSITDIYISIMRGTPLMLQIMVVYYGPSLLFNLSVPKSYRFIAVIIAFIVNYAAYFAEIYRGGINSIDKGQYDASLILGYSRSQTYNRIILPQMFKNVIPSISNEVITLVKDTSLASVVGTIEMFTRAKQIAVSPGSPGLATFIIAAIFYYIFNYIVSYVMKLIEKRFDYYR